MRFIDINPKTRPLTEKLQNSIIRVVYEDNTVFNHKINTDFITGKHGPRSEHPYIKNYLKIVETDAVQTVLVLNPDGSERYGPIEVPNGYIAVYRLHTSGGGKRGVNVYLKLGIVNKTSQTIHKINRDGTNEIITGEKALQFPNKINLMPEELEAF